MVKQKRAQNSNRISLLHAAAAVVDAAAAIGVWREKRRHSMEILPSIARLNDEDEDDENDNERGVKEMSLKLYFIVASGKL